MIVTVKEMNYKVDLGETESIEIKINGNVVFSQTVPSGHLSKLNFGYFEMINQ